MNRLLAELRTQPTCQPRIIVADAPFCDLIQITPYAQAGDHFALRYHPKPHFHLDAMQPRREFIATQGRPRIEEYGWLGAPTDKPANLWLEAGRVAVNFSWRLCAFSLAFSAIFAEGLVFSRPYGTLVTTNQQESRRTATSSPYLEIVAYHSH